LFLPASAAIMPSLLPAESLQAGNGLLAAMMQIGSFAGPVLGAILVTTGGPAPAFAVDAVSFAVSAAALALMRGRRASAAAPEPATGPEAAAVTGPGAGGSGAEAGTGSEEPGIWRLFLHARVLQMIVLIAVLANFVIAGAFEVALPALAHARYGAPGYGALIACFGVGSLVGTLVAAKLGGLRRPALAACAGFLAGGVAISFVPFLWGLPGAAAAAAVFGATGNFGNVVIVTLLQRWAPARLLGRVMSLVMLASLGAFPASVALSGVIVHHLGPAPFFPAAGAVLALAVVLAATQRQFRDFGAAAAPPAGQAAVVAAR
jgi:MFS family permease